MKKVQMSVGIVQGKALHEIKPVSGALIQFACTTDGKTSDIPQAARHCLFAQHLLENVARENADINSILQDVAKNVYQESNRTQSPLSMNGLNQHPEVYLNEVVIPVPSK